MADITKVNAQSTSTDLTPDQRNLSSDIVSINNQISMIQGHIKSVERAIEALHIIIDTLTDPKAKHGVYRTINELRITLSNFMGNHSKAFELKFKYRTQQANIKFQLLRVIEEKTGTEALEVMETLKKLSEGFAAGGTNPDNEVVKKLQTIKNELDETEKYNF